MAGLESKPDENLTCVSILKSNGYHTASVHCAYYAVFQYLKYSLTLLFQKTYRDLDKEYKQWELKGSTHDFYISYIRRKRTDLAEDEELGNFIAEIKKLRELRNKADYEEDVLGREESDYALKTSEQLKLYLKDNEELWKRKK